MKLQTIDEYIADWHNDEDWTNARVKACMRAYAYHVLDRACETASTEAVAAEDTWTEGMTTVVKVNQASIYNVKREIL